MLVGIKKKIGKVMVIFWIDKILRFLCENVATGQTTTGKANFFWMYNFHDFF